MHVEFTYGCRNLTHADTRQSGHAYALGECGKYTQTPAGRLPVPANYPRGFSALQPQAVACVLYYLGSCTSYDARKYVLLDTITHGADQQKFISLSMP